MAVIYPALGEEKAVAQQLLNMAVHVRDVQVSTDTAAGTGNVAFVVPEELYDRYTEALKVAEEAEAEPAPAPPKRRGRPRKVVPAEQPAEVEEVTSEESENEIEDESDDEDEDKDPEE